MKNKLILSLLCLLFPLYIIAQDVQEEEQPVKYTMLMEGGISSGSPVSICGEFAFLHGIKWDNKHLFALAFGIGGGLLNGYGEADWNTNPFYVPLYFNYRYFMKKQKRVTPLISASLGGVMNYSKGNYYGGIYSSFAAGFQVRKFYIIGGVNFTPMIANVSVFNNVTNYSYYYSNFHYDERIVFPVGIMLHVGLAF